jgi:hypothetical protein
MLRLRQEESRQISFLDQLLPPEVLELPEDLAKLEDELDDDHKGLVDAIETPFRRATWQRCSQAACKQEAINTAGLSQRVVFLFLPGRGSLSAFRAALFCGWGSLVRGMLETGGFSPVQEDRQRILASFSRMSFKE